MNLNNDKLFRKINIGIICTIGFLTFAIGFTYLGEMCTKQRISKLSDNLPYDLAIKGTNKSVIDNKEYDRLTDQDYFTPIETNAVLDQMDPQFIISVERIAYDVRHHNLICDSLSGLHINLAQEGLQVACNHFTYKYLLVDKLTY